MEIEEAAYVDGAGRLQALVRIVAPPVVLGIVALNAIGSTGSRDGLLTPCGPPRSSGPGSRAAAPERCSERG